MARLTEFHKLNENLEEVNYKVDADGFEANIIINKNNKQINGNYISKYDFLTDNEIKEDEHHRIKFMINKNTDNLKKFPEYFKYQS